MKIKKKQTPKQRWRKFTKGLAEQLEQYQMDFGWPVSFGKEHSYAAEYWRALNERYRPRYAGEPVVTSMSGELAAALLTLSQVHYAAKRITEKGGPGTRAERLIMEAWADMLTVIPDRRMTVFNALQIDEAAGQDMEYWR